MADTRGTVIWFEIWVGDLDRAKNFYTGMFGWKYEPLAEYDAESYWQILPGGAAAVNGALVSGARRESPRGRTSVLYLHVADLEEAVDRARLLGGSLVQGRTKISATAGSFAIVTDPDGNELGLWVE
jgi:predicted enzyme related to lactoylglutathione lyase